ncbi:late embryogenesis abundant protein 7-like [Dioscorea cayenensis subsp. rotundata]|uniref:Late embryogenesis abundant protein 7-like n=1 Tax=Dioscorea cayennensis subsp. rotundata TaxID=55577 RepID=A0AB40BN03_DIOCR|nr:late embryogenesis abundant protein 7-like [Dioscorea cayenensis subsp. rotundata]
MSNTKQTFNAGKAHGEGQAKGEQWVQSAKDTAHSIQNSDTAQQMRESKDQAAGFLQQTGEHVMQMAHDAADAVKNAVGMGPNNSGTTTTTTTTHSTHKA